MTAEPTKTTTLAEHSSPPDEDPGALRMAFREGNGPGVERMLLERAGGDRTVALRTAIQMAMDLRRQDVACLGAQEAFVRHGPDGSLEQVVAPVRLSLADKTLYQIPKWSQGPNGWSERIENPEQALVSYQGLLRINQVAGCAVGMPSTVWVDGEERMNPWREPDENGDTRRVVVAVNCVGPAPMTGALVVVQYTLEVQPSHDFAHMLLGLTSGKGAIPDHVYLIDREEWLARPDSERRGWKWAPLYAGVGVAHDLRQPRVLEVYKKQVGLLQNVLKKAQTVARRNAMRSHPALAFHAVRVTAGDAVVRGVGWAARGDGMGRYLRLLERAARGHLTEAELGEPVEVLVQEDTYDPAEDVLGDDELDVVQTADTEPEWQVRNVLIEAIDEWVAILPESALSTIERYTDLDVPELEALQSRLERDYGHLRGAL